MDESGVPQEKKLAVALCQSGQLCSGNHRGFAQKYGNPPMQGNEEQLLVASKLKLVKNNKITS